MNFIKNQRRYLHTAQGGKMQNWNSMPRRTWLGQYNEDYIEQFKDENDKQQGLTEEFEPE